MADVELAGQTEGEAAPHAAQTDSKARDEIDYGPDEGKPETEVINRLGKEVLAQWETRAIVPDGWLVNPQEIINSWKNLADDLIKNNPAPALYSVPPSFLVVPVIPGVIKLHFPNN